MAISLTSLFTRRHKAAPAPQASEEPPVYCPRRGYTEPVLVSLTGGNTAAALAVSTVHRCVTLIADSIASLPLHVLHRRGGIYVPEAGSPLAFALEYQPNAETSAFDFWSSAVANILMQGNAYIVPRFTDYGPDLRLCTPGSVSYDPYTDTYNINDTLQGVSGQYTGGGIIHLRGLTIDGKTGVSVLTYARRSLDIAARGSAEQEKRFANGGTVRGIVSNAAERAAWGENRPEQLGDIADYMDERLQAGARIIAQPGDGRFTQLTMSSADMQFLESRKFETREICRFFGVPPSFVFDDTSNNYKSAENAYSDFLRNTLNPLLRKIEIEFTRKLFPGPARYGDCRLQYDRTAVYMMDLESRTSLQRKRMELGTATINELRREDNMPAIDGGDTPLVTANLRPVAELSTPSPTPTNAPDND